MFEIQDAGRTIRVKPITAVIQTDNDGAIILERATAIRLVSALDNILTLVNHETEEEDG